MLNLCTDIVLYDSNRCGSASPDTVINVSTIDSVALKIAKPVVIIKEKKFSFTETFIREIFASESKDKAKKIAKNITFKNFSTSISKECISIISNNHEDLKYDMKEHKARFQIISQRVLDLLNKSTESSDNPGDNHVKLYDTIKRTQQWSKIFFNGIREIDPNFRMYNLNHIVNGDRKGGHHLLIDPNRLIEKVIENPENGVSIWMIKDKKPKKEGQSTFYPAEINSTTLLLDLLTKSVPVALGIETNVGFMGKILRFVEIETIEGKAKSMYLISMQDPSDGLDFIMRTCYPCLKVFEYDGNSPESLDFNGVTLNLNGKADLLSNTVLAFTSNEFDYYEIKLKHFGVNGIFIKVPKS